MITRRDDVGNIHWLTDSIPLRFQKSVDLLNPSKHDIILDIGCGEFALLEKVLACYGIEIFAIDINLQVLIKAKSNPLFNVHFMGAGATSLPLKSNCVDKIVALELVEHLPEGKEESFLKESNRVLKESGYLILSMPNYSDLLINILDPHWLMGHRHYRPRLLVEMLIRNGFKMQMVQTLGGIIDAFTYMIYLPWHFFWSHLLKRREQPLPFQRVLRKLSALDYLKLGARSTHIFMKAVKV